LEFNVPFQHKYGYIRDERNSVRGSAVAEGTRDALYRLENFLKLMIG